MRKHSMGRTTKAQIIRDTVMQQAGDKFLIKDAEGNTKPLKQFTLGDVQFLDTYSSEDKK